MPTLEHMTAPKSVSDQLRSAIQKEQAKGKSLSEIARNSDVAPIVVSRLMNGRTVTLETAEAIAQALGHTLRLS